MKVGPALLLLLALAPLGWMLAGRSRPGPGPRFRRMAVRQWWRFGLPAVALLGVTGRWDAFVTVPPEFTPARAWLGVDGFSPADRWMLAAACVVGTLAGGIVLLLVTAWRAWRGRGEGTLFGDARAVIPTERAELRWAAAVAVTAGVTEEAYFRLLLPLLGTQAFGHPMAAFAGAAVLFGAAHRYQGWRGMAATAVAGLGLTLAYLATASLVLAMALHAGGDLIHLVARPLLRWRVEGRKASAPPPR